MRGDHHRVDPGRAAGLVHALWIVEVEHLTGGDEVALPHEVAAGGLARVPDPVPDRPRERLGLDPHPDFVLAPPAGRPQGSRPETRPLEVVLCLGSYFVMCWLT